MSDSNEQRHSGALPANPLFAHLVERAASMLRARATPTADFSWWSDGEESSYIARLEWSDEQAPRVIVYDGRTGDFVCRSMTGDCFRCDPDVGQVPGTATDVVQRYEWMRRARQAMAKGRPAPQGLCALADEMAIEAAMRADPAAAAGSRSERTSHA